MPATLTAPAEPPTEPADPAPDERTEAQKAFDEAFDSAEDELEAARKSVSEARDEAAAAETGEARAAARDKLDAARKSLGDAVSSAQDLSAPAGDASRRERAADLVRRATEALASDTEGIAAAETSTHWYAGLGVTRIPVPAAVPEVVAVRKSRANAAGTANSADLLDADSFPAVPYEPGKVLISEGEASSGDMLRMRGFFPERIHDQTRQLQNSGFRALRYGDRTEVFAGLRITRTGLVMAMGGFRAEGMDFRRRVGDATWSVADGTPDNHGWDLTLTFGEPTSSPEGNGEAYWVARLMPDPSQIADGADADTRGRLLVDGRPKRVGTYTLWLSNHAGVDENLEPAEGSVSYSGAPYPEDDVNSFLKYAAYGMMTFASSDEFPRTVGVVGDGWRIRDRVQSFHLGYDAFEDESGRRTTDIGEAVSNGKFTGLTIALELDGITRGGLSDTTAIDMRSTKRLRGDVELTATISGTAADNNIEGRIRNLEVWDSRGYWKDYATLTSAIELGSGSISASGHYRGDITGVTGFSDGQYFGTFYGPVSGLETAGAWFLHGLQAGAAKAVIGSFGAKHSPPPAE